jgi:hypothetical protein
MLTSSKGYLMGLKVGIVLDDLKSLVLWLHNKRSDVWQYDNLCDGKIL